MSLKTIRRLFTAAVLAVPSGLMAADADNDGLDDSVETNTGVYVSTTNTGTNPNNPDSDGDGAGDWYEVAIIDVSPTISPQPNTPNNPTLKPNIPYPLPAPGSTPPATNKPVKVFILSGQSNMVGQGNIDPIGTLGTLQTITRNEHKFPNLLNGANWSVRNDVAYRGVIAATGKAQLTAGQGSSAAAIGPELGFGHVMGYYHDEPVLILKSSDGGKSLGGDFLPPGSVQYTAGTKTYAGFGDSPASWTTGSTPVTDPAFYGGIQFDKCFRAKTDWAPAGASLPASFNVTDVLDNFATEYPQYAAQGFEIAGFAWFQGWNDGLSYTSFYANRYERNMAQFIRQLRSYYASRYPGKINPKAPFVIATCAFEGWNEAYLNQYPTRRTVINAQLAVGNPALYSEFAGNVKTMEARGYWRDKFVSPVPSGNQGYHYNRSAETFMLVGDALGRGMIDLLNAIPPTLDASAIVDNQSGGPVTVNTLVTYTVTFSEDMNAASVTAADFGNAGTSALTIGTVTETSPGVFSVQATPTSAGTLRLRVNQGAELNDVTGNALVTTSAIPDDTTLTIRTNYGNWASGPFEGALTNPDPALDFDSGGLDTGIEWVVGGDPTKGGDDASLAPTLDTTTDLNGKVLFIFRRSDAANADANTATTVEYGNNLTGWTPAAHQGTGASDITITVANDFYGANPGIDKVTVAIPRTLGASGKLFTRLRVTIAQP